MIWELGLALALIVGLYARTLSFSHLIDDGVDMRDTLYSVPTSTPGPDFFRAKHPLHKRIKAISAHMLNTSLVYLILGGKAALLFAVFPVCANNVAWITGSYYSWATFLTLTSYYFLTHLPWWISVPFSMAFFATALNATLVTISYPFVFLFANPLGLCNLFPLVMFLIGKRFTTGKKVRMTITEIPGSADDSFTFSRIACCTKVVAAYVYLAFLPIKLSFFHSMGSRYLFDDKQRKNLHAFNATFFASVALILAFIGLGALVGKFFWAMWFVVLISAFSQYKTLGQFFAERYMYPALVGFVAVMSFLPDPIFWALVGMYTMRCFMFIPVFRNNRELYKNGTVYDSSESSNWCNLSDWYLIVEPDLSLAGYYAQEATKRNPVDYKPHVNMSTLFIFLKQYPLALQEIEKAIRKADGKERELFMNIMFAQRTKIQGWIADATQQPQTATV